MLVTRDSEKVYCVDENVADTLHFRRDPQRQGILKWCKGHHREELITWEQLGLTRDILEALLCVVK
jgi:hypothetical protein